MPLKAQELIFPVIAISRAGWHKTASALSDLTDASPTDDLADWQKLQIIDSAGNAYVAERAFRAWPSSGLGVLLCRLANHSVHVGFDLQSAGPVSLSTLISQVATLESLPDGATWPSHRALLEYLSE